MTRLLDALRSAIVPARGTPVDPDTALRLLAERLRSRRPRGAVEWARFVENAQRSLGGPRVVPIAGALERPLDAFEYGKGPGGTSCIPPSVGVPLDAPF